MAFSIAGIGSRSTPLGTLKDIEELTRRISKDPTIIIRTGGATGADQSFMHGAKDGKLEIYLPWKDYEQDEIAKYIGKAQIMWNPTKEAYALAEKVHPAWRFLKPGAYPLMARNCHIILGNKLGEPVKLVLCFQHNCPTFKEDKFRLTDKTLREINQNRIRGGTLMGIRLAKKYGIPIINFWNTLVTEAESTILSLF